MERIGDDIIGLIFKRIHDPNDRKSFSQVSRQWWAVACFHRLKLRASVPDFLFDSLPRYPNLISFECSEVLSNTQIEFLARTCPKLQSLILNFKGSSERHRFVSDEDFDDYGLCAVAGACLDLKKVYMRRRLYVGDVGVVSIVRSWKNLRVLDLARCNMVTDEALKAIGEASCLEALDLQGCFLITDIGLGFLTNGSLQKCLRKLVLAECDRITDDGVFCLKQMHCLEELNLAECGVKVTDSGAVALTQISTLKRLNLSWLINVTDITLFVLGSRYGNLEALDLTGCEFITGEGIRTLVNHKSLEELVLIHCHNFSGNHVEEIVLGCQNLVYLALDKRMKMWMPVTFQNNFSLQHCWIDWK